MAERLGIPGARHKAKGLPRIQRIFTLRLTPHALCHYADLINSENGVIIIIQRLFLKYYRKERFDE